MTTLTPSQSLAKTLTSAGYTAAQIGRALNPDLPRNAVYKAGMRVLAGTPLDLDRLAVMARGLGVTITITYTGDVTLETKAA